MLGWAEQISLDLFSIFDFASGLRGVREKPIEFDKPDMSAAWNKKSSDPRDLLSAQLRAEKSAGRFLWQKIGT